MKQSIHIITITLGLLSICEFTFALDRADEIKIAKETFEMTETAIVCGRDDSNTRAANNTLLDIAARINMKIKEITGGVKVNASPVHDGTCVVINRVR